MAEKNNKQNVYFEFIEANCIAMNKKRNNAYSLLKKVLDLGNNLQHIGYNKDVHTKAQAHTLQSTMHDPGNLDCTIHELD